MPGEAKVVGVEVGVAIAEEKIVRCPACSGDSVYAAHNRYRPFCSELCKNHDLGAWASESFRMPTEAPPEDLLYGDPKLQ